MIVEIRDDVVVPDRPEMIYAWTCAIEAARNVGAERVVMSGGREGAHGQRSKHWSGLAMDLYVWPWTLGMSHDFRAAVRDALPADFDVVLEASHVHVEFDPEWAEVKVRKTKVKT